jgi:tRNA(His) 5'-end guanylyltransferase
LKRFYVLKEFEKKFEHNIPPSENIVIRLDGKRFSKLTKKYFEKPFDKTFLEMMVEITINLIDFTKATIGYTQSDEITLIIPKNNTEGYTHIFNGRVQKIVSTTASLAGAIFNKINLPEYVIFDSRIFTISDEYLPLAINERRKDAIRNSRSTFARAYAKHSELVNKNSFEQIEYVKKHYGRDWFDAEPEFRFGVCVKKRQIERSGILRSEFFSYVPFKPITFKEVTEKYYKENYN